MSTPLASKPRVLSGVQPTGLLHLGNYLGAVAQWVNNQDKYDNFFCVVDLHAFTIPESPVLKQLHQESLEMAALLLACGIDPDKSTLFLQSAVPQHPFLGWLLTCMTPLGWLERMTQFKAKALERESVSSGLLAYPVLQAADILLYQADFVPVGEDQLQHLELTRDIVARCSHLFGIKLNFPQPMVSHVGAKIMGLDNPAVKMSKSIGLNNKKHMIGLLDSPRQIEATLSSAVTDSGQEFRPNHASAGVINLMNIYMGLSGDSSDQTQQLFSGKGYGFLKKKVAEVIITTLAPIQQRYHHISGDKTYLNQVLAQGAEKARLVATKTLYPITKALGIECPF
ncbi:MAG: tryptophan--tRNA ligase [Alphaproteobacteria bacterium]|nr:tryptophan--tRNA ligase [Alphaproteobacteria bacterium]